MFDKKYCKHDLPPKMDPPSDAQKVTIIHTLYTAKHVKSNKHKILMY